MSRDARWTIVFVIAFALSAFASGVVASEQLISVDARVADQHAPARAKPASAFVFSVNPQYFDSEDVAVDVGNRVLQLHGKRTRGAGAGGISWVGRVAGSAESSVVLSWRNGQVAGQLVAGTQQYEFATDAHGRPVVFEVDPDKVRLYPVGGTDAEIPLWEPDAISHAVGTNDRSVPPARRNGDVSEIDLMVVYTAAACTARGRDREGTCAAVEAAIVSAIELGNVALTNSAVAARLRIVHMAEVGYVESGDMTRSLADLRGAQSGSTAAIHALRDEHRADLVSLITVDTNLCGYAIRPVLLGPGSDVFGFSVVAENCILQALMHEIGHNFGAAHDRTNTSSAALGGGVVTPNAFGYRDCGANPYLTIMSYGNNCGRPTTLAHFSNPAVRTTDGRITGTPSENNAEALNFVAPWIEAYRDAETTNTNSPPEANPDSASTRAGEAVSVNVLGNDTDAEGPITLDAIDLPAGWAWQRDGQRAVITPPLDFSGVQVLNYRISDADGLTASSTIRMTVQAVEPPPPPVQPNRPPVVRADVFEITAGEISSLDVLANDGDPDGDTLRLNPVTVANGWTARVVNARLEITAPITYRGTYRLRYSVRDDSDASASALITLNVIAPQSTPPVTPPVSPTPAAAQATGLRYRFNSVRTVVLNWKDVASNETRYQIIRDRRVVAEIAANSERFIDRQREIGARHEYRVRAMSAGGGRSSAPVRVTIGEPTLTARILPRNASQSVVVLQWTGASGAQTLIKRGTQAAARVANDGNHSLVFGKGRRVAYRVCNIAQTLCSRAVVVTH